MLDLFWRVALVAIILIGLLIAYYINKNYEDILKGISRISLKKVNEIIKKKRTYGKKF